MPPSARPKQSPTVIHTLVVVDDKLLQTAIDRRLNQEGHAAATASTAREAIERLRREIFDVVLCDLHATAGDGTELLQWLGSYFPSIPVIVIVEALSPEFRGKYEGGGSIRLVEKPIDLDKLVSMIETCGPRRGFFGNQIEIEFFDYVQMIAVSGRDKAVIVNTRAGTGYIWFEHGDIVHAQWGEARGEAAFYKMLAVGRGSFRETLFRPPPARTIVRPSMHLLMEAARQADEGILGTGETVEDREDSGQHEAARAAEKAAAEQEAAEQEAAERAAVERAAAEPAAAERAAAERAAAERAAAERAAAEARAAEAAARPARAPMPKPERPATNPPRPAPTTQPPARKPEARPGDIDMAGVADSAIARIDDIALPQDDEEVEARAREAAARAPTTAPPEAGDGVPTIRRRVQTLERVVGRPTPVSLPARGRAPPTAVPAIRATPASLQARATPASTPAVSRATPASTPAVRPGQAPPARAPGRTDTRPFKKASTADLLEDPETRELMLGQFWQFEGVNGVAIISNTGKVVAEDMRNNNNIVTLAGFFMRGAARIARTLGYHVFDGVIARSVNGQQMIMVGMGATSAVLSVAPGHDPEAIRDAIMGVETKR